MLHLGLPARLDALGLVFDVTYDLHFLLAVVGLGLLLVNNLLMALVVELLLVVYGPLLGHSLVLEGLLPLV